jgi:hypothetical protein
VQSGAHRSQYIGKRGPGGALPHRPRYVAALTFTCVVVLVAIGAALLVRGRGEQHPLYETKETELQRVAGAAQTAGWTEQAPDRKRLDRIGNLVMSTGAISEADLNWSLDLLKRAGAIAPRTQVMLMLARAHSATTPQRERIRAAAMPYLSSPERLERKFAQRLLAKIDHGR